MEFSAFAAFFATFFALMVVLFLLFLEARFRLGAASSGVMMIGEVGAGIGRQVVEEGVRTKIIMLMCVMMIS